VDRVQLTVGLFFEHVEIGKVVLPPVRRDVAEHPHAKVRVAEDEAAEIAGELLNAHAHRARIEERGAPLLTPFAAQERQYFCRIAQTPFGKHLLDGVEAVQTRFAFAHINVDDAIFTRSQEIDVRDAGDLKPPVNRFERSVAFEEIEREDEVLVENLLAPTTEKFQAAGTIAADVLRHRQPAHVKRAFTRQREVHKNAVADDRVVTFQDVLAVWVEDVAFAETRVFRGADAPAVPDHTEIRVFTTGPALAACRPRRATRSVFRQPRPRPRG